MPGTEATAEAGRGRQAERPRDLPARGWRDILLRTRQEITDDHLSIVAAGVAFYALLALFPAIAALVSLWGLVFDPQQIAKQVESVSGMLPQEAASIIKSQARKVASGAGGGLTLAAIGGVLLAIYSAGKGTKALMEGLNIVNDETESRGFLKLNLVALVMTFCGIVGLVIALGLIAALPAFMGNLGLGRTLEALVMWLRWPLLFAFALTGLAVVYRYAPSRDEPRWRWVSWGATAATTVWVVASLLFSIYVRNFGSYNETYGSLGAVIILLMWLWLSAYVVLLGAELNSEMEHQTTRDSTAGQPEPMGRRGAHAADTVGEKP